MAMNEQAPCVSRFTAESQNGFDVSLLRQQNVRIRLDRIVEPKGRAKVWIERLEGRRVRPFRVENRQDVSDTSALVADELVKSANGEVWEG